MAAHSLEWCWAAAINQDSIRWQNFVEGKLDVKWQYLQEEHYVRMGSNHLVAHWVVGLVTRLLELVHRMWKT